MEALWNGVKLHKLDVHGTLYSNETNGFHYPVVNSVMKGDALGSPEYIPLQSILQVVETSRLVKEQARLR